MPSNNNSVALVQCTAVEARSKRHSSTSIFHLCLMYSVTTRSEVFFKEFFDVINLFRDLLRVMKLVISSETVHRFVSIDLLVVSSTF